MYICRALLPPQRVVLLPAQGVLHLLDARDGLSVVSNESPIQHSTPYSTPMYSRSSSRALDAHISTVMLLFV